MKLQIAKLFQNGRSQAVRLPKEFRFEGEEVLIRKKGNEVILAVISYNCPYLVVAYPARVGINDPCPCSFTAGVCNHCLIVEQNAELYDPK